MKTFSKKSFSKYRKQGGGVLKILLNALSKLQEVDEI